MLKDKNVLVTGGSGFVGVNLINRLLDLGANVTATLHKTDAVILNEKIKYVLGDLTNRDDCARVVTDIGYVFMCAANTSGAAVMEKSPLVHVTPNIIMNSLILEASYSKQVKKFLFISSSAVYPVTDFPVKEEDVTGDFFDKYFCVAWMKRFSEVLCEMYATKIEKPMQTIVIRPGNLYGEYDDFEWGTSHVIPSLIRRVVERHDPIKIWGDGKDIKNFIYIQDFIDGILLALKEIHSFYPINIAAEQSYSIEEVINAIIKIDGYKNANVIYDKNMPTMIKHRTIDISKAKKMIGFTPKTSLKEGLSKTIKWYRNKY